MDRRLSHLIHEWYSVVFDEELPVDDLAAPSVTYKDDIFCIEATGPEAVRQAMHTFKHQFEGYTLVTPHLESDPESRTVISRWVCVPDESMSRKLAGTELIKDGLVNGMDIFELDPQGRIGKITVTENTGVCLLPVRKQQDLQQD